MAAVLGQYSVFYLAINGQLLAEEASLTISRDSKAQPIFTVYGGFRGMSQGAATMELSVENAVPIAGFEFDTGKVMQIATGPTGTPQVVEFTIYGPGVNLTAKGFIVSDTISHSVNSESKLSFKAICEFKNWQ